MSPRIFDHPASTSTKQFRESTKLTVDSLTTYDEVLRSYPSQGIPDHIKDKDERTQWWADYFQRNKGLLHRVHFHRFVLDEADKVKNYSTRGWKAVKALKAQHRWIMTGTPITDLVEEIYSYWKILHNKWAGNIQTFRKNYCRVDDPHHPERLSYALNKLVFRRTYEDKLFGAPILKLPKTSQDSLLCELSGFDRALHDAIVERYTKEIQDTESEKDKRGLVLK